MLAITRLRTRVALGAAAVLLGAAACGGGAVQTHTGTENDSGPITLTMAYGSTYVMITPQDAQKWWSGIAKQFHALHPNVTVKLVPIPGSYLDIVNKLSLLYRSPSTAPTIAELPTGQIGEWASSGYLLPLNTYLPSTKWWGSYSPVVQSEGTFGGTTFAVNQGENDMGLYYNKQMFAKAGIPTPWQPKSWADIISAAKKIKAAVPGVSPLFVVGGTASGTNGILLGVGNLLVGSSTPTIYDTKSQKWVVNSSGLMQTFRFLHSLTQLGLNAPTSEIFNPNALNLPPSDLNKDKVAIDLTGNYVGESWVPSTCAPCWPQAPSIIGAATVPTIDGSGSRTASTLGGWDLAIYKGTQYPKLAFQLLDLMQSEQNMVTVDNYGGWVPPSQAYQQTPGYLNFAPPYQKIFGDIVPHSTLLPTTADYSVWGQGFEQATGALIQNAGTTPEQAAQMMQSYLTQQLGAGKVETLP